MSDDKDLISERFISQWKAEFESTLRKTVTGAMGYSDHFGHVLQTIGPPSKEDVLRYRAEELRALTKFHQSFLGACKKSGMLLRHLAKEKNWRDYEDVGEGRSEWLPYAKDISPDVIDGARKFNLILEGQILKARRRLGHSQKIPRRRQRIPNAVAMELLRIIQRFSGDRQGLELVRQLTLPGKYLDQTLLNTAKELRTKIIAHIESEMESHVLRKREYKAPRVIQKLNLSISADLAEIKRIRNFKVNWTLSKRRGSKENTLGVNHFKDHLIKSLLSDGGHKIAKNLKGLKRKKADLLRKVERKNRETLLAMTK